MRVPRLTLPAVSDAADYRRQFNSDAWRQAAAIICARHGITHARLKRSAQGENIIFLVDETYVVKIFAPCRENYLRESAALRFAQGKLSIRTPELIHTGEIEGWSYLVMTQLAGRASREVWAETGRRDRLEIISRLGVALSELHAHAAPLQTALDRDWRDFIRRQARSSVERQRSCGASQAWLESLPAYIAARLPLLETDREQVFLHGDIHAGNLLLAEQG